MHVTWMPGTEDVPPIPTASLKKRSAAPTVASRRVSRAPPSDDTTIGDLLRDIVRSTPIWFVQLLRRHLISVTIGFAGWVALASLSVVDDAVCVAGPNGTNTSVCLQRESYVTIALMLSALLLMANEVAPDLVMLGTSVLLVHGDIISQREAWAGFGSPSVLSIGALFVVARALEETRAVEKLLAPILGAPTGHVGALLRLCVPVAIFSAFLNNTPIVAMLLTVCEGWAARSNLSIKVLLMPLSFASMLGGMCTLIGTSTNLVLNAQIESDPLAPLEPLTMFSMTLVGLPAAIVGILFLSCAAPRVFRPRSPPRSPPSTTSNAASAAEVAEGGDTSLGAYVSGGGSLTALSAEHGPEIPSRFGSRGSPRYTLEALVTSECTLLVGQPPSSLGQLVLPQAASSCDARLLIRRGAVHPVRQPPTTKAWASQDGSVAASGHEAMCIEPEDRLLIACLAEGADALRRLPGLVLRPDAPERQLVPSSQGNTLLLVEAAIASGSPLVGLPLAEALSAKLLRGAEVWALRGATSKRAASLYASSSRSPTAEPSTPLPVPTPPLLALPPPLLLGEVQLPPAFLQPSSTRPPKTATAPRANAVPPPNHSTAFASMPTTAPPPDSAEIGRAHV